MDVTNFDPSEVERVRTAHVTFAITIHGKQRHLDSIVLDAEHELKLRLGADAVELKGVIPL